VRTSLLVLLALVLAAAAVPFDQVQSQTTGQEIPLSMGFGPGVMSPISEGIPVYTAGDQMWLMSDSHDQLLVTLHAPDGSPLISVQVTSSGPSLLSTFSAYDPAGTWSLSIVDESQPSLSLAPIPIVFVQNDLAPPNLTSYSLSGTGLLRMNFNLTETTQYDIQDCAVGSAVPEAVSIPLPPTIGSGQLLIERNGTQTSVSAQGQLVNPFNFWVELHQNYSYYLGSPTTVVSRDVRVAATEAVSIVPGASSLEGNLTTFAQIRTGRFTLRAFFDTPSGLSVTQTQVVIPNDGGGWISLPGCSASADVPSSAFSISTSLGANSSTWPTAVYTMYQSEGVEMVAETPLHLMPAVVNVVARPWETPLTDSQLEFTPGPQVLQSASDDGSLYLVASQYPVQVGISLDHNLTQEIVIEQPFSSVRVSVNSSKLDVQTYLDGSPAAGIPITILEGGESVADTVSGSAASVFYLPDGNYTVEATLGNVTLASGFVSQTGAFSVVSVRFTSPLGDEGLYVLLSIATIGAVASALLWVKVYRDRR